MYELKQKLTKPLLHLVQTKTCLPTEITIIDQKQATMGKYAEFYCLKRAWYSDAIYFRSNMQRMGIGIVLSVCSRKNLTVNQHNQTSPIVRRESSVCASFVVIAVQTRQQITCRLVKRDGVRSLKKVAFKYTSNL